MSSQEAKSAYYLIEFVQNSEAYRYTNWSESIQGYSGTPEIEIELDSLSGTFEDEGATIRIPRDDFVESLLVNAIPFPVTVRMSEVQLDSTGSIANQSVVFRGQVDRAITNRENVSSLVSLECVSVKNRLNTSLGIPVGPTCWKRFLSEACQLKEVNFQYSCVVQSIDADNFQLVVSGLPTVPDDEWFAGGWLTLGAVRVACRYWNQQSPGLVYVRQIPPESWIGETVTFTAGCLQRQSDCDARDNSINFGGIGKKIPAYSPQFETGTFV